MGTIELVGALCVAIGDAHVLALDAIMASLTVRDANLLVFGAVVATLALYALSLALNARAVTLAALGDALGTRMLLTLRPLRTFSTLHAHALLAFGTLRTFRSSLSALGSLSTLATATALDVSRLPAAFAVRLGGRRG